MKTSISDQNEREVPVRQVQTIQRSTPEVETMVLRESDAGPAHYVSKDVRGFVHVTSRGYSYGCRRISGVQTAV